MQDQQVAEVTEEEVVTEVHSEESTQTPVLSSSPGSNVVKGGREFSTQAVKVAHVKPQPTKEKPPCKGPSNNNHMQLKQPGGKYNNGGKQ